MSHLLDTTTCVFHLRGRQEIDKRIIEIGEDAIAVSEITVAELLYGAQSSMRPVYQRALVLGFLSTLEILPIGPVIERFSVEKARLRRAGTPVGDFDILIGVTAVEHGLTMVSDNERDLGKIEGIELVNWVVR